MHAGTLSLSSPHLVPSFCESPSPQHLHGLDIREQLAVVVVIIVIYQAVRERRPVQAIAVAIRAHPRRAWAGAGLGMTGRVGAEAAK